MYVCTLRLYPGLSGEWVEPREGPRVGHILWILYSAHRSSASSWSSSDNTGVQCRLCSNCSTSNRLGGSWRQSKGPVPSQTLHLHTVVLIYSLLSANIMFVAQMKGFISCLLCLFIMNQCFTSSGPACRRCVWRLDPAHDGAFWNWNIWFSFSGPLEGPLPPWHKINGGVFDSDHCNFIQSQLEIMVSLQCKNVQKLHEVSCIVSVFLSILL